MKIRLGFRILLLVLLAFAFDSAWAVLPSDPKFHQPVVNAEGNYLYIFYLDENAANNEDPGAELPARRASEPANRDDIYGWHQPRVRALVKRLEREHGLKAVSLTSWLMPTFAAYASHAAVAAALRNPAIDKVEQSFKSSDYSTWSNRTDGAETVPWGKIAIGTDDSVNSTGNIVYVIDGNVVSHPDLAGLVSVGDVNGNYIEAEDHATHVTGIITALRNNAGTRGVTPSTTIINVHRAELDSAVQSALDWTMADAEQKGIYAIANLSSSAPRYASSGAIAPFLRRISNRLFLVEAAGNERSDACSYAYGPTNANDGIMVIGGTDENNAQAIPYDNSAIPPYGVEDGSNYGTCVEAWAPSQNIYSTWINNLYVSLSGTSMAAPHVSGLAARYGTSATTPVERENYIRSILAYTGTYDIASRPIQMPSYTQSPAFTVGHRLFGSATADATLSGTSTANVSDSIYLAGVWNAGHGAPAWIEFDLQAVKTLTSIRMTPEQSPTGSATHYIYAGNSPAPTTLVQTITGNGATLEPFAASLIGTSARYVRVYTASSQSWVAWREIEVYGY